jgi:hypothetical protein
MHNSQIWNQLKSPSTDEWIRKMWYLNIAEYYSVTKKNEIMSFVGTWIELEITMLSEISQAEKNKYHMLSCICGIYFLKMNDRNVK